MQGKKILIAVLAGFATSITTTAFAMSVPYGWYLEANFGSAKISNKSYPSSSTVNNQSGIGGNVNFGYKFMPYFAAEAGYTQYANTSIKDSGGTTAGTAKNYSYGLWGKGIYPIAGYNVEVFAKLGIERMNSHISINSQSAANSIGLTSSQHSATGVYWGAGGQYYFMPEFAVVVQWMRAQGSKTTGTGDLLSIGASFIFD